MLDSTKIFVVTAGAALPSDVRSSEASTTQSLYLKGLIELLIRRLNYLIVREDCKANANKSIRVFGFDANSPHMISQESTSSAGLWATEILFGPSSLASFSDLAGVLLYTTRGRMERELARFLAT